MEPINDPAGARGNNRANRDLVVRISHKSVSWALAAIMACAAVYGAFSETLTMTAFYPSPYGAYYQLLATNNGIFARDSGTVTIGTKNANPPGGNVLTVSGNAAVVPGPSTPLPTLNVGTGNNGTLNVNGIANIASNATIGGTLSTTGNATVGGTLWTTGNATIGGIVSAANISATNNISARGVTLGDGGVSPAVGTLAYIGGTVKVWTGSAWNALSATAGLGPPGTILTINGTSCPAGTTVVDYYYSATSCNGVFHGSAYGAWTTPTPCTSGSSCITAIGWQSSGGGTCTYLQGSQLTARVGRSSGGMGSCITNPATCSATTWSQVKCQVN